MSLVNANEAKQKSISNISTKNLDELLNDVSQKINLSTDHGIFSTTFIIPKNTPENIIEAFLQALNKKSILLRLLILKKVYP